jgi:general secretion pathway protein D
MCVGVEHRVKVAARVAIFGLLAILLGGCSVLDKALSVGETGDASDAVIHTDLTARNPAAIDNRLRDPTTPAGRIYGGASDDADNLARLANPPPAAPGEEAVPRGNDSYDLNFQNADINAVTKVLLGDILKVTYSVDPRVQGTLSLSSGRPVPKSSILTLYESAAKIVNANVVREGGIYKVVPIGEALGNGEVDRANLTPGYGISVLPLHYVSAKTVLQALDSFATKPGTVRVDPTRNILLVQGASTERATAIETALALDVDWMKNQSVGVFPVRNASPDTIIKELNEVFDVGKEGSASGLVRFQPINRLNAVLAISQSAKHIREVKNWIARLDRADYDNTTVRVYKLRYGNAKQIAAILKDVFTGQGGGLSSIGNADLSQLTPGSTLQRGTSTGTQGGTGTGTSGGTGLSTGVQSMFNQPGDTSNQTTRGGVDQGPGGSRRNTTDIAGLSTSSGSSGPAPFPNVRITADVANNSLLIYASRDQYKMVERAIFELDRAPLQVAIDVTVAEVSLKNQLQYGVQYYLSSICGKGASQLCGGSIGFGLTNVLHRTTPGANLVLGSAKDPAIVLSALKQVTDVKVLSAPALVVLDNQQAVLQVGDEVPIITRQATDTVVAGAPVVNSVDRRNTGVILKVTPRVNSNGVVNLDVSQEVSQVASTDPNLGPTISQRLVQSSVAVTTGQTVLLGGLISSKNNLSRSGVPILMDIKALGDLFAQTDKSLDRTELIIFIRPQIIRNGMDAQLVAEELRSKLGTLGRDLRPPPHGPSSRDAR